MDGGGTISGTDGVWGSLRTRTQALVIVAHPRSGTHITLDFIRRNFPAFQQRLRIWESASGLYIDLDGPAWRARFEQQRSKSDRLLLQSHHFGLCELESECAFHELSPRDTLFIYPFRRFSATMRSFADFSGYPGPVADFLFERDRFFGLPETVRTCALLHGQAWLDRRARFLDVDALIAQPERAARRLGRLLGLEPAPLQRRLPRRRRFYGKLAEAFQRLTGRESTEVRIHRRRAWSSPQESAAVDERFADLHARMTMAAVL